MPSKEAIERAARQLQAELTANAEAIGAILEDRCPARARRGTGEGMCGRPVDDRGQCDRPSDHIDA